MKKFLTTTLLPSLLLFTPTLVRAQGSQDYFADNSDLAQYLGNIIIFFNQVIIPFIIGLGFLVFVWGMFQYFIAGGANDEAKEKGKSLMIYATLGFVLIIIFWGIVNVIAGSTGLDDTGGYQFKGGVDLPGGSVGASIPPSIK